MVWIIIASLLILSVIIAMLCFFNMAFVKQNIGDIDDMENSVNKPLKEYKNEINESMEYVKNLPFEWVETVSFDGLRLKARYFDNNSDKTIFLFHGYRASALRDFACAVKMYRSLGFNILLCDQRSHGRSEGRIITFGVKESRDVIEWVDFVMAKYRPEKIVLSGISMGATTVLLACGYELPKNVKAVIADCGFSAPVDIIKKVAKEFLKIKADFVIPLLDFECKLFGRFSIKGISTAQSLKKSDIPVLFIHGKKDSLVPYEMSQLSYDNAPKGSRLLLVENAGHGLSFMIERERVIKEITDFFETNL